MESRPVRLGWLSLLLTVIILCLATLSVLSFSTARADLALAQKQARQAQSVYALECAGQQWLAELDVLGLKFDGQLPARLKTRRRIGTIVELCYTGKRPLRGHEPVWSRRLCAGGL